MGDYVATLNASLARLADAFAHLGLDHPNVPDMAGTCKLFAEEALHQRATLRQILARYDAPALPRVVDATGPKLTPKSGKELSLLRDLRSDLLLVADCNVVIDILSAAAAALRDGQLATVMSELHVTVAGQQLWLQTKIQQVAAQALTVPQ